MPRLATIERLPEAFAMVKAMQACGLEWGEGYRPLGRQALAAIIEGRMDEAVEHGTLHPGPRNRAILERFLSGPAQADE